MFGSEYWRQVIDFDFLADAGVIDDDDLDLFRYAETAEQAWNMIQQFHNRRTLRRAEPGSEAWSTD
jgi:predicted Rossmann-fold nucleotide-binding protein